MNWSVRGMTAGASRSRIERRRVNRRGPMTQATTYRRVSVDGVEIFYREAGSADAPTLLLLHGFPSSSYHYRTLIELLSDRFHVIAPDYPGFGYSDAPRSRRDGGSFVYTFDSLADWMERFCQALGL